MNAPPGNRLSSLPIFGITKVRDLVYFQGPLLSHFRNERGDHYLYYWCDCDQNCNRWLVCRVSETNIIRLANKFIPLSFIIPNGIQDDFVYFIDLDTNGGTHGVSLALKQDIPAEYMPEVGAEPVISVGKEQDTYAVLIEDNLSIDDLGEIPTRYSQAYTLLYLLKQFKLGVSPELPWLGGFSSMHFYSELPKFLPGEERPKVLSLQYASPGFIRFRVRREIADEVSLLISQFADTKSDQYRNWSELSAYFTENKLNDLRKLRPDDTSWNTFDPVISEKTIKLLRSMSISDPERLLRLCHSPFEAAKITMSLVRKFRKLGSFEKQGMIKFPAR